MNKFQKSSVFLLRVSLGWLFFYAGITKVMAPAWSAEGYLKGAKMLAPFYNWLLQPNILPATNFLNEWGLTLVGVALILGVVVRLSSVLGALMMLLYYIPLGFPYPNPHSLIVDEHVIYIFSFLVLGGLRAGRVWGLENWCSNLPVCRKFPKLRGLLG